MRTEKSKLLQISLCVLSCVFFGCGNKNNNSTLVDRNETNTSEDYNRKDIKTKNEVCNPLVNVLQKVFESKKVQKLVNDAKEFINEDGSLKEGKKIEEFNNILDKLTKAIEEEADNVLEQFSIDDLLKDVESSENISDIQDPHLKKILKNLNSINNIIESLQNDPLKYLYKSGKNSSLFFHRSTLKALDFAWNRSVKIIQKAFVQIDEELKKINENSELDENLKEPFNKMFKNVSNFCIKNGETRAKILDKLYKDLGDKLLNGNGNLLFGFIDVNKDENKISSDWSDFVFCYYYLGTKTSRREFANLACVYKGASAKDLGKKGIFDGKLKELQDKYCDVCREFFKMCLDKKIISDIPNTDIVETFKDKKNKKLALSPWMMICAKDNFNDIVKFLNIQKNSEGNNEYTLDKNATSENLKDKSPEFKAGVLAVLNFCIGLSNANDNNKIEIDKTIKDFEKKLNGEVLKERKNQWEDIKKAIAADKESTEGLDITK